MTITRETVLKNGKGLTGPRVTEKREKFKNNFTRRR